MWARQQRQHGGSLFPALSFFLPVPVKASGAGAGRTRCGRCPTPCKATFIPPSMTHQGYALNSSALFLSSSNWNPCMRFSPQELQACRYLKGWMYFQVCYFPEYSLVYQGNKPLLEFGRILSRITPFKNSNSERPWVNFKMWIQFKIGLSLCWEATIWLRQNKTICKIVFPANASASPHLHSPVELWCQGNTELNMRALSQDKSRKRNRLTNQPALYWRKQPILICSYH